MYAHSHATDGHGSTNFKTLYEEIEAASGFSLKKELYALLDEVYRTDTFDGAVEKSAALTIGMQQISKFLYDVVLTEMIGSDDAHVHELALHAVTVSFHVPHMHGGRGHSGEQDAGSHELMHVLNPRKGTDNVRDYLYDDYQLTADEGAELRDMFQNGTKFSDIFGKNGGMSADGMLGQAVHPKGLANLVEWIGFDMPKWGGGWSNAVTYNFVDFDSNNSDGAYLGFGKKGNGGSDLSHGPGRAKFEQTFEVADFDARLNFVAGEASGMDPEPSIAKMKMGSADDHDHGMDALDGDDAQDDVTEEQGHSSQGDDAPTHDHAMPDQDAGGAPHAAPAVGDDYAQTAQNRSIWVDVLANDADAHGKTPKLVDVSYDGSTSLVSISGNKIKVNPLSAHRDDRTEVITYTVEDDHGSQSTGTLRVDIGKGAPKPAPAAPEAPEEVAEEADPLAFYFVDTETDDIIGKITDGGSIAASKLDGPVSIYGVAADDEMDIHAVKLTYDGHTQMERVEPYALFGNNGDNYLDGTAFERGEHEVAIQIFNDNWKVTESINLNFDVI